MAKDADQVSPQDFHDRLLIDRSDLESALEDHPTLVLEVGDIQAELVAERDTVKMELDKLEAAIDKELRADAVKHEEKITEKSIANSIIGDNRMQAMQRKFLKAKADADAWGPLREAIHQRGYALRSLVDIELRKLNIEADNSAFSRKATEARQTRGEIAGNKARAGVERRR